MDATNLEALAFGHEPNSQQPADGTLVQHAHRKTTDGTVMQHAHMGNHRYSIRLRYDLGICTASTVSSAT